MKLKTDSATNNVDAVKKALAAMEKAANAFKEKADDYARTIQDDTSKVALEIVTNVTAAINEAKRIIKESGDKAGAGINAIEQIEEKARQMRGKI